MTRRAAIIYLILSVVGLDIFLRRRFFYASHFNFKDFEDIISELADLIIPSTDTPGAREANVSQYIINVANNCMSPSEKRCFFSGLEKLRMYRSPSGHAFIFEANEIKEQYLLNLDKRSFRSLPVLREIKQKIMGPSFYDQIRWLTVSGFCQSRLGATKALAYDDIADHFVSCTSLQHSQKSWATK